MHGYYVLMNNFHNSKLLFHNMKLLTMNLEEFYISLLKTKSLWFGNNKNKIYC